MEILPLKFIKPLFHIKMTIERKEIVMLHIIHYS